VEMLRGPGPVRRGDQRGMTMIELVVAMALMAVALLALAASFPYAMYAVAASGMQTAATLLAQQAIERAQNADYRSLARLSFDGSSGTLPAACGGSGDFRPVASLAGFSRCVAVQPGVPTSTMTTITAAVEFGGSVPGLIWRTTLVTVRAG
jgi:prepilin-type N-terminal cleavage/methylation domain-containing protein